MRGFSVSLSNGTDRPIEAESYQHDDSGALILFGGGIVVERFSSDEWTEVHELGDKLSEDWPYPNLDDVLRNAFDAMARFGSFPPKRRDSFLDWRLNDLDEFVAAIVATAGIDASSTTRGERDVVAPVKAVVAKEFDIWNSPGRRPAR